MTASLSGVYFVASALASALLYALMPWRPFPLSFVLKAAPVACLALAVRASTSFAELHDYAADDRLCAALALSAAGDALFELGRHGGAWRALLAPAVVLFGAAHVGYVAIFATLRPAVHARGVAEAAASSLLLSLGVLVAVVLFRTLHPDAAAARTRRQHAAFHGGDARSLRRLVYVLSTYVLLITVMGVAALFTRDPLLVAGALCYIASDSLIAAALLVPDMPAAWRSVVAWSIWPLYYVGQSLITFSVLRLAKQTALGAR